MSLVTVVIPTRHEASNVSALVQALAEHAPGAEALFVDDSDTPATVWVARSVSSVTPDLQLRAIHRPPSDRHGGLAGAVLKGLAEANLDSQTLVVMDGDLQHPAAAIPRLLEALNGHDIAIASRYSPGGDAAGLDGTMRHVLSRVSTWLVKLLFPRRLYGIKDPLAGYFAIRREAIQPAAVRPAGFKILLDLLVVHPHARVVEIPVAFGERDRGASKSTVKNGLVFLRHLLWLQLRRHSGRP